MKYIEYSKVLPADLDSFDDERLNRLIDSQLNKIQSLLEQTNDSIIELISLEKRSNLFVEELEKLPNYNFELFHNIQKLIDSHTVKLGKE